MKQTISNWKIPIENAKIVFLDKDGVLNHEIFYKERLELMTAGKWTHDPDLDDFSPISIKFLNELTDTTGAKIVLSAGMRYDGTLPELQELFTRAGITGQIIGRTPYLGETRTPHFGARDTRTTPRGIEIEWWLAEQGFRRIHWSKEQQVEILNESKVLNYVILDDDPDMLNDQREHFVKCNSYKDGFNQQCLKKAIEILSVPAIELYSETFDLP